MQKQEQEKVEHEKNKLVAAELVKIADKHGGILKAEDVVEEARKRTSPLHDRFTWDDSEAARKYRLEQARALIRVIVNYETVDLQEQRIFVSLTSDRNEEGGGYRFLVDVLSNRTQRQQLLDDAKRDMESFTSKYRTLSELAEVFTAMKNARRNL